MTTILTKRSNTPGAVPVTANLTNAAGGAELAVNTADKRLFTLNSANNVVEVGTNPSSLTCADVSATVLRAGSGTITNLIATTAAITDFSATVARVGSLTISSLSLSNATVTSATITTLTGTSAGITTISSDSANITQLQSTSATVTTLTSTSASITNLTATSLVLSNLSIASANVTTLTSASATITNLINTSASITTLTNNPTFSAGTANGVLYLNGSKVATSGSALTWDGTNLGVGTASPSQKLDVTGGARFYSAGNWMQFGVNALESLNNDGGYIRAVISTASNPTYSWQGDQNTGIFTPAADTIGVTTGGTERMRLTSSVLSTDSSINVGIGTASPTQKLTVAGNILSLSAAGTDSYVNVATNGVQNTYLGFNNSGSTNAAGALNNYSYIGNGNNYGVQVLSNGSAVATFTNTGNLGIGTATPAARLHAQLEAAAETDIARFRVTNGANNHFLDIGADEPNKLVIFDSTGSAAGGYVFRTGGSDRMRLDTSGNLGIGTASPSAKLHVVGNQFRQNDATGSQGYVINTTSATTRLETLFGGSSFGIRTGGAASDYFLIDSSGNLGLGGTPSGWGSTAKAFTVKSTGSAIEGSLANSGATNAISFVNNGYYNAGWKYVYSGGSFAAGRYDIEGGEHRWYTAPSGTAGNPISFTQAMVLDASGNLGVGTASPSTFGLLAVVKDQTADTAIVVGNGGTSNAATTMSFALSEAGTKQGWLRRYRDGSANTEIGFSDALLFTGNVTGTKAERGRFTAGGLFLVNIDTSSGYGGAHRIYRDVAEGDFILSVDGGGEYSALFADVTGANYNTAACAIRVGRNSSTLRSINAGGTVNASGADYAEYMTKAGDFAIAKGDVCGVNADGKLTNVFADAISFVVKSTDPSYVGGDTWGSAETIGLKMPDSDASQEEKDIFNAAIETARQKVDRIAFAGQVPVNVLGATPGQYIVPVNDNGAIKGVAVSNPTFEQYQSAVGKVIAVQDDGRALIIVKVA